MAQLAQANVARLRAPLDDPVMAEFVATLPGVNVLAEQSPGFVRRLRGEHGHGLYVSTDDARPAFLNLSIWTDYLSLHTFVYRSMHGRFVRERGRWCSRRRCCGGCAPARGHPSRMRRGALGYLRDHGPTPRAFSLRRRFTAEGALDGQRGPRDPTGRF